MFILNSVLLIQKWILYYFFFKQLLLIKIIPLFSFSKNKNSEIFYNLHYYNNFKVNIWFINTKQFLFLYSINIFEQRSHA